MKKKLVISLVLLLVAGGIFAYYHHKQTKMNEFMTYYNDVWVSKLAMENKEISNMIDHVKELDEKGEMQELANYVEKEALPVAKEGLNHFKDINPKNDEIRKMNQLTIKSEEQRIELLNTVISYSEDRLVDKSVYNSEKKYREELKEVTDYAQKLIDKNGLKRDANDQVKEGFERIKPK